MVVAETVECRGAAGVGHELRFLESSLRIQRRDATRIDGPRDANK